MTITAAAAAQVVPPDAMVAESLCPQQPLGKRDRQVVIHLHSEDDESETSLDEFAEEAQYEHACSVWFRPPEGRVDKELASLSRDERERVWADLSGNSRVSMFGSEGEPPKGTEQTKLNALQKLLEKHACEQQDALAIAIRASKDYVCHTQHSLLPFLSSQDFHVENAYKGMKEHYNMKRDLFGERSLGRDITWQDTDIDCTLQCLYSGAYQMGVGGARDRAGRVFSVLNVSYKSDDPDEAPFTRKEILRCMFYQNMLLLRRDPSVQRMGVVRITYFHQDLYPPDGPDNEFLRAATALLGILPIRTVARYLVVTVADGVHSVLSSKISQNGPLLASPVPATDSGSLWLKSAELLVMMTSSGAIRLRSRIIYGSYTENMYTLLCLGLPTGGDKDDPSAFPLQVNGRPTTTMLHQWLDRERHDAPRSFKRPRVS